MDDSDTASSWLSEDKRIFIYTFTFIALVVGGHRTWQECHKYHENATRRARILRVVENSRREKERADAKLNATMTKIVHVEPVASSSASVQVSERAADDAAVASSSRMPVPATKRSKERRKRGRDAMKEVVKQERRTSRTSKQPLRGGGPQISGDRTASTSTSRPRALSNGRSSSRASSRAQTTTDCDSADETPQSRSTSQLPISLSNATERAVNSVSHLILGTGVLHDDRNVFCESPTTLAARIRLPDSPEPISLGEPSTSASSPDYPSETPLSIATTSTTSIYTITTIPADSTHHDETTDQNTPADTTIMAVNNVEMGRSALCISNSRSHEDASSSSSCSSGRVEISQPTPYAPPMQKHPSWLGNGVPQSSQLHMRSSHFKSLSSSSVSSLVMSENGWENDNQLAQTHSTSHRRGKSPPPRFRSKSRASASPSISAMSFNSNPNSSNPSVHIASYKGALEAARQREETCQRELKRCREECDMLKWRLSEDTVRWQHKEAELRAQMQYLMHQLQALSIASSSQAHLQYHTTHQHQQQPLHSPRTLGGFPVMPPIPFGFPSSHPGQHPQPHTSSNGSSVVHSHLAFPYPASFPTPGPHMNARTGSQSGSASSPALDFTPPTYFQGMHNVNGLNGANGTNGINGLNGMMSMAGSGSSAGSGGSGHDREDDFFSDELAEAILKRPESIRSPTSTSATSGSSGSRSASVTGRATRDGAFTFPSLSELGNPQSIRREQQNGSKEFAEESQWEIGGLGAAVRVNGDVDADSVHEDRDMDLPKTDEGDVALVGEVDSSKTLNGLKTGKTSEDTEAQLSHSRCVDLADTSGDRERT